MADQAIDFGFPLRPGTRYHYRDNFLDPREGPPDDYNHVRVSADGTVHRLHDGIDIYAAVGEPLVATFSGTVINPGTRWPPWEADRYGNTVAIVSDEPATNGYTSIYVHADRVWVQLGDHVTRGQVVGTVGALETPKRRASTPICISIRGRSCWIGRPLARTAWSTRSTRTPHW